MNIPSYYFIAISSLYTVMFFTNYLYSFAGIVMLICMIFLFALSIIDITNHSKMIALKVTEKEISTIKFLTSKNLSLYTTIEEGLALKDMMDSVLNSYETKPKDLRIFIIPANEEKDLLEKIQKVIDEHKK